MYCHYVQHTQVIKVIDSRAITKHKRGVYGK